MTNQPSATGGIANQRDFSAMLGGANEYVDFSAGANATLDYLPVPDPSDNLETTARKLRVLADVVTAGYSLAVRTGFQLAAHQECDPEALAKSSMTPQELTQYEAWRNGARMPHVDWANDKKAVPPGAGTAKRYTVRATAISRIWDHEGITAENAAWLTSNMTYAIPLVVAVSKVQAAERELRGGQKELTDMELAEVQTAHRIVAIASDNMNQIARDINSSKEIIQAREQAIKSKMANWKPKKDPVNDKHKFVGLAPNTGRVDYTALTAGTRAPRTNLLAGTGLAGDNQQRKRPRPSDVEVPQQQDPAPMDLEMTGEY